MASISTFTGVGNSPLVGQTTEKIRPPGEQTQETVLPFSDVLPEPSGLNDPPSPLDNAPEERMAATWQETQEVAAKLQEKMDALSPDDHQVSIATDESTQAAVIQIKDRSGEVIRQFPPEKVLNLYRELDDLSGMVIDAMT